MNAPAVLTKKAQVLEVLRAGGHIYWRGPGRLYELQDKQGNVIGAWQNAMKGALKEWHGRNPQ